MADQTNSAGGIRDGEGNNLGTWQKEAPTLNMDDSNTLAMQITLITGVMQGMDWPYFEQAMLALEQKAQQYDTTAVLNRAWTPEHGEVLTARAKAMRTLWDYRQQLLRLDLLQAKATAATVLQEDLVKLFQ